MCPSCQNATSLILEFLHLTETPREGHRGQPARRAAQKPPIIESDSDGGQNNDADSEDEHDNIIVAAAPAPREPRSSSSRLQTSVNSGGRQPNVPWKSNNNEMTLGLKVIMKEFATGKGHVEVSQIFANTFQEELVSIGFTEPPKFASLNEQWRAAKRGSHSGAAEAGWNAVDRISATN